MDNDDNRDGPPSVASGARTGGRGPRVARHSDVHSELCEVPYKAVVQARQERVQVEAFLRRYAHGEGEEYVQDRRDSASEEHYLVGGKFPGVYYRPVKVCSNCYMVYTLVDGARSRALRRARRSDGGKRHPNALKVEVDQPQRTKGSGNYLSNADKAQGRFDEAHKVGNRGQKDDSTVTCSLEQPVCLDSENGYEQSQLALSLAGARRAMDAVSQGDVSELRSFGRPPAAVEHVASVAMTLLEGKSNAKTATAAWVHARATMSRGDFFLRLQTFDPRKVTPQQVQEVQPALESPGFDPAVVRPHSNAAGNLCLWVLGVVQANRWMTGCGHPRTNVVPSGDSSGWRDGNQPRIRGTGTDTTWLQEPPFPQHVLPVRQTTPRRERRNSPSRVTARKKRGRVETRALGITASNSRSDSLGSRDRAARGFFDALETGKAQGCSTRSLLAPATSPMLSSGATAGFGVSQDRGIAKAAVTAAVAHQEKDSQGRRRKRDRRRAVAQAFASGRLAGSAQASMPAVALGKDFVCSDGKTRLPYRVCGDPAATGDAVQACNFVVVHDLFDNVDKTEVLFRPVTRRHRGCRVLAFSYPGQSGTVFRVPPSMIASTSGNNVASNGEITQETSSLPGGSVGKGTARTGVPNNAFVAPRLHELLQYVHSVDEMRLSEPFHLVRIIKCATAHYTHVHPVFHADNCVVVCTLRITALPVLQVATATSLACMP